MAIEAGLAYAPPLLFAGLRLLIAGIVLFTVAILWNTPLLPARPMWPWLIVLALAASAFAFGSMFLAPRYTGAGVAAVLGNTQPLIAIVLAALFLGERVTRRKMAALVLGLAGVALIAEFRPASGAATFVGPLLAFASAMGLTVGSVIVKRVGSGSDLLMLSAWQLSLGAVPLLAVSLATERATDLLWAPQFLGLLAFLSLAGTAFLTVAWYVLIRSGELGRLSLFFFLVPAFGLGLAVWLLGETVSGTQGVGLLLVVAALAAAASPKRLAGRASGPGAGRRARTASDGSDRRPSGASERVGVADPMASAVERAGG